MTYIPVLSQMYLASRPTALQHRVKQLAHSPQRPLLVSSSFSGLLYLVLTRTDEASKICHTHTHTPHFVMNFTDVNVTDSEILL